MEPKVILSASRRTDLVRCFPRVLSGWLAAGRVTVRNPFDQRVREIGLMPETVHTLVLWSKDFSAALDESGDLKPRLEAYDQLFFQFTITGLGGSIWEPGVRPWRETLRQFEPLVRLAQDPQRVQWRFDPVVVWREGAELKSNLRTFGEIARAAQANGLKRVTLSFCQWYLKAQRRARKFGLNWVAPRAQDLGRMVRWMQGVAGPLGLELQACCQPELAAWGVGPAACIPGELLAQLHPRDLGSRAGKDPGQRKSCHCARSIDIGDYALACPEGCVYCYANPKVKVAA